MNHEKEKTYERISTIVYAPICDSVKVWFQNLLARISALVESEQSIASLDTGITKCSQLVVHGPQKRRRTSEYVAEACATQVLQQGLAVSAGAFVRAHPGLLARSDLAYISFNLKYMKNYLAGAWMNFHDATYLSIVYDGFRAGFPVVENLGIGVYDVARKRSAWAPLMDSYTPGVSINTIKIPKVKK